MVHQEPFVLYNRKSWGLGDKCALWFVGSNVCVVQEQARLYTKRCKRLQNQNCLGQVFTSAFCLALLMEVERCLPVSLSPGTLLKAQEAIHAQREWYAL